MCGYRRTLRRSNELMITTVNTGWELYVYCNGNLIYKRWLRNGQKHGRVFHDNEGLTLKAKL